MTTFPSDYPSDSQTPQESNHAFAQAASTPDAPDESANRQEIPDGSLPNGWNYESTVQTIEQIIDGIEMGEMELADIFDQFAIAVDHLHQCESFLTYHREQVDLLIETLSDDGGF